MQMVDGKYNEILKATPQHHNEILTDNARYNIIAILTVDHWYEILREIPYHQIDCFMQAQWHMSS